MNFLKLAAAGSIALLGLTVSASAAGITTEYNVTPTSPGLNGANNGPYAATDPAFGYFAGVNNNTPSYVVQTDTLTNIQLSMKVDTSTFAPNLYSDGVGNYVEPDTSNTGGRAAWDFFFSINVNADGASPTVLSDYHYNIMVTDLNTGVTASYDPLGAGNDDSGFGPDGVTQGDHHSTTPPITAIPLDPSSEWIAQNAENIGFNFLMGSSFNGADPYQIQLQVLSNADNSVVDDEAITVNLPEPGTTLLMTSSLGVLGLLARRRRRV